MEKYQFDSETKAALEKLRVPLAVYQFIDKRVVTILLSDGFCELFGFDNKDDAYYVMDHDMYRATHPEDRARAADAAYRFAIEGGNYEVVYRTLTHKRTDYMIVHAIGEHVHRYLEIQILLDKEEDAVEAQREVDIFACADIRQDIADLIAQKFIHFRRFYQIAVDEIAESLAVRDDVVEADRLAV